MEAKLKHLEFIQAVIARLAGNSFLFKGWALTLAAGILAFATANSLPALVAIAVVSTGMFWGLDAYYLWLERSFVQLYNKVAAVPESRVDFCMTPDKSDAFRKWLVACKRPHLCIYYGAILTTELIAIFFMLGSNNSDTASILQLRVW